MNEEMRTAYAKIALKGKEGKPIALLLTKEKFVINLLRLHGCRIDEPEGRGYEAWARSGILTTYFNLAFDLIIFLKFSFVTNSSSSSRSAKLEGDCFIWRFATSCFTTSATVKVGSILTLTTPSLVATLFVGIRVLEEAPLAAARERRASPRPFGYEDMSENQAANFTPV
jgi:hypothetical protein